MGIKCFVSAVLFLFSTVAKAQSYTDWVKQAPRLLDSFLCSEDVLPVVDNVLASQLPTGAWPKNVNFFHEREQHPDDVMLGTIDNNATFTEISFLFRYADVIEAAVKSESLSEVRLHHVVQARQAGLRGLEYLLTMQYANGGFPQYFPRRDHYHAQITFNDNAMVNVLKLLRQVSCKETPFQSVPDSIAIKCDEAFSKGIDCILRSQIVRDGHPTVWCQQHDSVTLLPVAARSFELASFVSAESVGIVELLMSIDQPTDSVCRAVEGAVGWFRENALHNLRVVRFMDAQGRWDVDYVENDSPAISTPRLWARFYDLQECRPLFCGRDGVPHSHVSEIEYERRNGYAWYVTQPERLFPLYEAWKKRHR